MSVAYAYAIVPRAPREGLRGLLGEPLRAVRVGTFVVMVGDLREAPAIEPEMLRGHDATVRRLADRAAAILPFRFGAVFASEGALHAAIAPRRIAIADALALVHGSVQMTLRVYGTRKAAAIAPRARARAKTGAAYLEARARAARDPIDAPWLRALEGAVAPFVQDVIVEAADDRAPGRALRASIHHLVPRDAVEAWSRAVLRIAPRVAPLSLAASGPWAPYAFAHRELS